MSADKQGFWLRVVPAANPIVYDDAKCIGCNRCMEVCQVDIFIPNELKGRPPIVAYPDECWYCGACVMECPRGAIQLRHPLMNKVQWVEKNSLFAGRRD